MFEFKSLIYVRTKLLIDGEPLIVEKQRARATEAQAEVLRQSKYWEELRRVDPE